MKQLIALNLCLFTIAARAQDSTAFQRLQAQFAAAYFESEKKTPSNNYFGNLGAACTMFNPFNETFMKARAQLFNAGQPEAILVEKIFDSVIGTFCKQSLWQGLEPQLAKYRKSMQISFDRVCPCYTEKLADTAKSLTTVISECDKITANDQVFVTRLSLSLSELPMRERMSVQKYFSRYAYQNCEALNKSMNQLLLAAIRENYFSVIFEQATVADEKLIGYWERGKKDSLKLLFPKYEKSIGELKKTAPLYQSKKTSFVEISTTDDKRVCTRFFAGDKQLIGKAVFVVIHGEQGIEIQSFQFTPGNKIPQSEREKILQALKEVPPPVEVMEVKD